MPVVLKDHDADSNPPTMYCTCGYVLNGLMHFNCPECGRAFNPSISSSYLTQKPEPGKLGLISFGKTLISMTILSAALTVLAMQLAIQGIVRPEHLFGLQLLIWASLAMACVIVTFHSPRPTVLWGACLGTALGYIVVMISLKLIRGQIMDGTMFKMGVAVFTVSVCGLLILSFPGYLIAQTRAKKNRSATDVRSDSQNS